MGHECFDAARQAVAAGRFQAALKMLEEVQAESPDKHRLLGAAHIGRRNYAMALAHLRQALDALPDDPETLLLTARALTQASQPHAAIAILEGLAASAPSHPGVLDALATAYRRDARYEDVLGVADRALALGLPPEQPLYEKAMSLTQLSRAEEALACFDAVLKVRATHAAGLFNSHGPALEVHGPEEALLRLHRAVRCEGANGKYWAYLWSYNALLGRTEEAARIAQEKLDGHSRRRYLADAVGALLPALRPDIRLFGLSAPLLRHALSLADTDGMVLEFGVRRGHSINHIAAQAGQKVHGFDSFEGLPEAWGSEPQGVLSTGAQLPPVAENVVLHPGWFSDTLPRFLAEHPGPVRFVNIDSDIYSSAKTVLTALAPRMQPGTILVFDEFIGNRSWREDEYKAFHEFAAEYRARFEYVALSPYTKQVAIRLTALGK
ncbi:class I SAM-dependent methyltransferase [Telmatospirillum sp. J64-1]|uniref:class I SAM-dependent methyltransferase n=1 Tax=Telmatospirillum sp. J64-1 TaxID=2502183 RepID=UPI00210225EB|nr:class I SAM-dependent methyltransferase [Telmatospirillum sp. J64-1]